MKTSLGGQISSLHCTATSSLGRDYYSGWVCHAAHSALVLWLLVAPPPQAGDLDHEEALEFLAYPLCGSMVGHVVVHVSLIKNNSFVLWPFPLLQKTPGQLPFNVIQHSKM